MNFYEKNYNQKITLILLGLLMSMQAYAAETVRIVDTEAVLGLDAIEVSSANALGSNTFSDFESAVNDFKIIEKAPFSPSQISSRDNNLADASEVIVFYGVSYLVSVADQMLKDNKESIVAERIFNEATIKVMDELDTLVRKSNFVDGTSSYHNTLLDFVDPSIFEKGGTLLGTDGKPVSGCSSLFCGMTKLLQPNNKVTKKAKEIDHYMVRDKSQKKITFPNIFTAELFNQSKQLSKIMAPANKKIIQYFGGVRSEKYRRPRPGNREYGGDLNVISSQLVNQPRVKQNIPLTNKVQPQPLVKPMDNHHPDVNIIKKPQVKPPTPPVRSIPVPMDHHPH